MSLKIERGNRIFPVSDKSSDIIKAFEKALNWANVKVCLNTKVEDIFIQDGNIKGVVINGKKEHFDAVIIATGGVSYPSTGF